jgi:small-conductance mechanosensitive channel
LEPETRKLIKYILLEFAVFLLLVSILLYITSYLNLDLRIEEVRESIINMLPMIVGIVLIIVITKMVLSLLRPAFDRVFEGHMRSHAEVKMIWRLIANIVWIFIIILLLSFAIGDFSGILAFGVVMAALLYALQKPILNMAGWLDIIFHRPFSIGDRIEIHGKKGYVVDVGMFHSTLREFGEWMEGDTFTGRLITIPNANVFESPVLNYTKDTPYIWDEIKTQITYESDHENAKMLIFESALEVVGEDMRNYSQYISRKMDLKDLRKDLIEEPQIRLDFSDSALNIYVIYFCPIHRRRTIKSEIVERILTKIKKDKKVHIAYPHVEVVGVKKNK